MIKKTLLLVAACSLALLASCSKSNQGTVELSYSIFFTHAWTVQGGNGLGQRSRKKNRRRS
jgi:major membrane immunogen (membrane-anchored lipoprotein)